MAALWIGLLTAGAFNASRLASWTEERQIPLVPAALRSAGAWTDDLGQKTLAKCNGASSWWDILLNGRAIAPSDPTAATAATPLPEQATPPPETPALEVDLCSDPLPPALPIGTAVPAVPTPPYTVLIIGDSMIEQGFGVELERALMPFPNITVYRKGKYSTGLSRDDYFDWNAHVLGLLEQYRPNVVVAMFGTNDAQGIWLPGHVALQYTNEGWDAEYEARARKFMGLLRGRNLYTFWVGMPNMAAPKFAGNMARLNRIFEASAAGEGMDYVSGWDLTSTADGAPWTLKQTADGKTFKLYGKDGIHLTEIGGRELARNVLRVMDERLGFSLFTPAPSASPAVSAPPPVMTPTPAPAPNAAIRILQIDSIALDCRARCYAVVPGGELAGQFPAVVLLPGWSGAEGIWQRSGSELLRLSSELQVIIVVPDSPAAGWFVDSPRIPGYAFESYVVDDVLPALAQELPLAGPVGLAGWSAGGHGALTIPLRRPGRFASVSAIAGIFDLPSWAHRWRLRDLFGPPVPENSGEWDAVTPVKLIRNFPDRLSSLPLLITVGTADGWALGGARQLRDTAVQAGVTIQYEEVAGAEHHWSLLLNQLPRHLAWHAEHLCGGTPLNESGTNRP